jgi:diketogulonate reductase-like aldo/keto reductase
MNTLSIHSRKPLRSGNRMPLIGLGTWQLTDQTADTVAHALQLGYPMIDTSGDYGTQPGIAEALRKARPPRESFYLVTKVEETDDAYAATRKNLAELGLAHADLMLVHRPPKTGSGEELWRGLIRARNEGLARDIGVSNYSVDQIRALAEATGEMPAVNQIEWSPFGYGTRMRKFCHDNQIVIQAYSPLTRTERLDDPALTEIAEHYGKTTAQILLRWNLQHGVVPLPKANRKEHMEENLRVFDFRIDVQDLATLDGLNERYSSLGTLPYD